MRAINQPEGVVVAVGVVLDVSRLPLRVLVSRRKAGTVYGGFWEFPGGKVERGESLEAALHRELLEEVGVRVEVCELLTKVGHVYGHGRVELHAYVCAWSGAEFGGEPRAIEVAEVRWVSVETLRELSFPEANTQIIEALERWVVAKGGLLGL